uniref:Uncharacterized protein n=1 Tax=Arundo donax TaxID=35708 RepID=A0A0A8YDD1_ARUDO
MHLCGDLLSVVYHMCKL